MAHGAGGVQFGTDPPRTPQGRTTRQLPFTELKQVGMNPEGKVGGGLVPALAGSAVTAASAATSPAAAVSLKLIVTPRGAAGRLSALRDSREDEVATTEGASQCAPSQNQGSPGHTSAIGSRRPRQSVICAPFSNGFECGALTLPSRSPQRGIRPGTKPSQVASYFVDVTIERKLGEGGER